MSLMPALPPPKRSAESRGAQNVCRGVNRADISVPVSPPAFGTAPCTTMKPPSPSRDGSLQESIRDHQPLDLGRAFVDLGDPRVAEVPLDVELLRVAHPAVDLDGLVGDPVRGLAGVELGHARLPRVPD